MTREKQARLFPFSYLSPTMSEERKIFTLTQLNIALEKHFFSHFSNSYFWITAEIIKINQKNGHYYVELADNSEKEVTARSSGYIWASNFQAIVGEIGLKETQGILQAGNKVLFNVKIEYHKIYGLKLKIRQIDPSYSYGEIERKRQETIQRLKTEGLFGRQQRLRLPIIIKRIALIGSPNTSGFRDFQNELFNKGDFNNFKLKVFPVSVQGEAATKGIVEAIKEANLYDAEAIVLIRGGGSKMDLALFDTYEIAKAICLSRLPVLTGIGHETDEVVADLVARLHLITPTAVAQHIQYGIFSFQQILRELKDKTIRISMQMVGESRGEFVHLKNYLSHFTRELIHYWRTIFQEQEFNVLQKSKEVLYAHRELLSKITHHSTTLLQQLVEKEISELLRTLERIELLSIQQLENEKHFSVEQLLAKLYLFSQQIIDRERIIFKNQEELLILLNPIKILQMGYTISTIEDNDIKDVKIESGMEMKTLTVDWLITSKIIEKLKVKTG